MRIRRIKRRLIFQGLFYRLAILILLLAGSACREDSPLDFTVLDDPAERGRVDSTGIGSLLLEESFRDTITANGRGPFLEIGKFRNLSSRILLKFDTLPDTFRINGVTLFLDTNTLFTEGSSKSLFNATVHRVTADWQESSVTGENFGNAYDPAILAEARILSTAANFTSGDSVGIEAVRFDFNATGRSVVSSWQDSTRGDNFGILVDFDAQSRFVKEFFSEDGLFSQPRLELDVTGTVRDTILRVADADAFLLTMDEPFPAGPLLIEDIFSSQAVIKFDLSSIPRQATINRALLQLEIMTEESFLKESGYSIRLERLASPFVPPSTFEIDSTFISLTSFLDRSTRTVSVPVTGLVQFWTAGTVENHGILLRTLNPGRDLSRVAFHSSTTSPTRAPRLQIDFSIGSGSP